MWRLIDSGPCRASFNMAIDEAIARSVREGKSPPTLRLYGWLTTSVTIGCFQKISSINLPYCIEKNIPVVRRLTGGRAILHNHELTYSFSVMTTKEPFSKGLLESYRKISEALSLSLSKVGFSPEMRLHRKNAAYYSKSPLCFNSLSYGEITLNNRKIVGSAQKRWRDGLLQQGSIPYTVDEEDTRKVFGLDRSADLKDRMAGLMEVIPDLDTDRLKEAIRHSFEEAFETGFIHSRLSQEEYLHAQELEAERYLSQEWNLQR
ncbi:MAG: lipoate--protein ligase family protein [Thermodesulfovibrionales bacterium]